MFKKILFFSIFSVIFIPQIIQAQENSAFGIDNLNRAVGGIGLEEDLESSVANIIRSVLVVTGTIFLILVVAAGILWMTAAGNPEKIKTAKSIVIGATIGLLVILSAYLITSFIANLATPKISGGSSGSNFSGSDNNLDGSLSDEIDSLINDDEFFNNIP